MFGMGTALMRCAVLLSMVGAAVTPAPGHGPAQPIGMVLSLEGQVTIRRAGKSVRAQLADFLFEGDRVVAGANSKMTFSFCPASERVTLNAGGTVLIAPAAVEQLRGAPAVRASGVRCTLPEVALGQRDIEHIGVVATRGTRPIAIYVGGVISSARPQFSWAPVIGATDFKLVVKTAALETIVTRTLSGSAREWRMPDAASELQPGVYVWMLTALVNGELLAQDQASFEVKPDRELPSTWPPDPASQLELAVAFENAGYYSDAARIYRTLQSMATTRDARFTRHLVWLYSNAGLSAAMNEELKRLKDLQQ